MYSSEQASFRLYKQTAFIGADPTSGTGILIPGEMGFNAKHTRSALPNKQVQADGFERRFAQGNHVTSADGSKVINFNYLGHELRAITKTTTSVAFTGLYWINVDNGGTGYDENSPPTVVLTGGGGGVTPAVAKAIVIGGSVFAIVLVSHGDTYTADPVVSFTGGGGGTGAAATAVRLTGKFLHTFKFGVGAANLYTLEKGVDTIWDRQPNMTGSKISFTDEVEGICSVNTTWGASGHKFEGTTPIDANPVEVTGTPGEYANFTILEGGEASSSISKLTADVEVTVREKRIPGRGGYASQLVRSAHMLKVSGDAYFESRALANKMKNATLTRIQSVGVSPDGIFHKIFPEVQFESSDWERRDDGIYLPFTGHSLKEADTNAPGYFQLINGVSSY